MAFLQSGSSSTVSRLNWNLEVLIFVEGGKSENPEKNRWSKDESQQQTQPTFDAGGGGGVLPYMGYIGTCAAPKGMVFQPFGS